MSNKLNILEEVKLELDRFTKKLDEAIKEQKTEVVRNYYHHAKYASAKRGALDLKKELTKLTQDSKYVQTK